MKLYFDLNLAIFEFELYWPSSQVEQCRRNFKMSSSVVPLQPTYLQLLPIFHSIRLPALLLNTPTLLPGSHALILRCLFSFFSHCSPLESYPTFKTHITYYSIPIKPPLLVLIFGSTDICLL